MEGKATSAVPGRRRLLRNEGRVDESAAYVERHLAELVALTEALVAREVSRTAARSLFRMLLEEDPVHYRPAMDALLALHGHVQRASRDASETPVDSRLAELYRRDTLLDTVVKKLLVLWYNAALGERQAPPEAYPHALVWDAIAAHPLGLPGSFFGSWSYPPATVITDPSGRAADDT